MTFQQKLDAQIYKNNSLLCVGLDPDEEKIPQKFKKSKNWIFEFNKYIIDQTKDLVCCYKPDIAFYEAYGMWGLGELQKTLAVVPKDMPVLLDAKRGSVGHTAKMYAKSVFEFWKADAVTVNIFTGISSLQPFLKYQDKWSFAYIVSSNRDGQEFQKAKLLSGEMLYEFMAQKVNDLPNKNIGAIVPATDPKVLKRVREIMPKRIFLIPGIGAQGGEIASTVNAAKNVDGKGIIISVSRSVLYVANPRAEAQKIRDEINKYRI